MLYRSLLPGALALSTFWLASCGDDIATEPPASAEPATDAPRDEEGVFLMESGKARFQPIYTGLLGELSLEVSSGLKGGEILLDETSVTATENALMAAVLASGRTVIRNAASEPHVQELGMALMRMGARINGIGTNTITIDGAERLKGVDHTISSDHMEVGSLIAAIAMTHGDATIKNAVPQHMRMTRMVFQKLGVETEVHGEDIHVVAKDRYVIEPDIGGAIPHLKPQIWPGFPSDLTSVATAMATQAEGTVLIHEWMFEARMFWVDALVRMGARLVLADPHRVVVVGPSQLYGTDLRSPDIRAGMAILAATLCATGQSVISNVEQIDRGFEELDTRLRGLGAKIERAA